MIQPIGQWLAANEAAEIDEFTMGGCRKDAPFYRDIHSMEIDLFEIGDSGFDFPAGLNPTTVRSMNEQTDLVGLFFKALCGENSHPTVLSAEEFTVDRAVRHQDFFSALIDRDGIETPACDVGPLAKPVNATLGAARIPERRKRPDCRDSYSEQERQEPGTVFLRTMNFGHDALIPEGPRRATPEPESSLCQYAVKWFGHKPHSLTSSAI
jgi:hypothetical protein